MPPATHDPKAVMRSAAKLAALMGTTCLFVGLLAGAVLMVVLLEFGAQH